MRALVLLAALILGDKSVVYKANDMTLYRLSFVPAGDGGYAEEVCGVCYADGGVPFISCVTVDATGDLRTAIKNQDRYPDAGDGPSRVTWKKVNGF